MKPPIKDIKDIPIPSKGHLSSKRILFGVLFDIKTNDTTIFSSSLDYIKVILLIAAYNVLACCSECSKVGQSVMLNL